MIARLLVNARPPQPHAKLSFTENLIPGLYRRNLEVSTSGCTSGVAENEDDLGSEDDGAVFEADDNLWGDHVAGNMLREQF